MQPPRHEERAKIPAWIICILAAALLLPSATVELQECLHVALLPAKIEGAITLSGIFLAAIFVPASILLSTFNCCWRSAPSRCKVASLIVLLSGLLILLTFRSVVRLG